MLRAGRTCTRRIERSCSNPLGWSYFFGQSEGKAKVDSDWV